MSQTANSSDVYYKDLYWNDHPKTQEYFSKLLLSNYKSETKWWPQYFFERYLKNKACKKALFINCGNGWAEREMYNIGMFEEADAFDYSEALLEQAREAAAGMPLKYFQADCNLVELANNQYDLVVNVAAMHHVKLIDRLNRILASSLKEDGLFVNFDYVGPHRNQYSSEHFRTMTKVNASLPNSLSHKALKPAHLPTMLHLDPTEAIHSELVLEYFERYFYTIERKDLHGAIAYQLMHNNHALFDDQNPQASECVDLLLKLDHLHSDITELPTLFSFFIGKPRKELLQNERQLKEFSEQEAARESAAEKNGGLYY